MPLKKSLFLSTTKLHFSVLVTMNSFYALLARRTYRVILKASSFVLNRHFQKPQQSCSSTDAKKVIKATVQLTRDYINQEDRNKLFQHFRHQIHQYSKYLQPVDKVGKMSVPHFLLARPTLHSNDSNVEVLLEIAC